MPPRPPPPLPPQLSPELQALYALYPADWVPGILDGRVEPGWSGAAVIESWGPPRRIARPAPGAETWHYPRGRVMFQDGKVRRAAIEPPVTPTFAPPPGAAKK